MDNAEQKHLQPTDPKAEPEVLDTGKPQTAREALLCAVLEQMMMGARQCHAAHLRWRLAAIVAVVGNIIQWWMSR